MKITNPAAIREPIAVYPICNCGGWEILSIEYRPEGEFVEVALNNGDTQEVFGFRKLAYPASGREYFRVFGQRLYLDQFIRI